MLPAALRSRVEARLQRLVRNRTTSNPAITAKLLPLGRTSDAVVVDSVAGTDLAPPPDLWGNYASSAEEYLEYGRLDVDTMLGILGSGARSSLGRVLDLGCGAGRMIRHLPRRPGDDFWGADINAAQIRWCQENLRSLNFVTTTTFPCLPFEDGYFDLVYAASVFTHITDLTDAWLLEIKRVLKPGGLAYLTIHDLASYEQLLTNPEYTEEPSLAGFVEEIAQFERQQNIRGRNVDVFWFGTEANAQVFYDREYLTAKWSKWMRVLSYHPQVHNYQSALVIAKPD